MDLQSRAEAFPFYQIIESPLFASQFEQLVKDPKLRDEIQRAFFLDLPIRLDEFPTVPGTKIRFAIVNCSPPLTAYFTVKDRIVTLLEIHAL